MTEPGHRGDEPPQVVTYDLFGRPVVPSDPPSDSKFLYAIREGPHDSPEHVYLWAKAVLRQLERIEDVGRRTREADAEDRHVEYVDSDRFHDLWCEERADRTFLMEAAKQMLSWARGQGPAGGRGYGLPGRDATRWIEDLRNLLIHYDETYRGERGPTLKRLRSGPYPQPDDARLRELAQAAISHVEQGLDDYAAWWYAEQPPGDLSGQ